MNRCLFSGILDARAVIPALEAVTKDGALLEAAQALAAIGGGGAGTLHGLFTARERQASTAIGDGIAVPHIKWDGPFTAGLALSRAGIEFGAMDGKPVHVFFLLAAPWARAGEHLKIMARISRLAFDERLAAPLKETHDIDAIMGIIRRIEGDL